MSINVMVRVCICTRVSISRIYVYVREKVFPLSRERNYNFFFLTNAIFLMTSQRRSSCECENFSPLKRQSVRLMTGRKMSCWATSWKRGRGGDGIGEI